jgi:hypothetical protein
MMWTEILLKVAVNTITLTPYDVTQQYMHVPCSLGYVQSLKRQTSHSDVAISFQEQTTDSHLWPERGCVV